VDPEETSLVGSLLAEFEVRVTEDSSSSLRATWRNCTSASRDDAIDGGAERSRKIGGLSSRTNSLIVGPGRNNPSNALHARCISRCNTRAELLIWTLDTLKSASSKLHPSIIL